MSTEYILCALFLGIEHVPIKNYLKQGVWDSSVVSLAHATCQGNIYTYVYKTLTRTPSRKMEPR